MQQSFVYWFRILQLFNICLLFLIGFSWWSLWDFLYIKSCHLQIVTVLLLPFLFGCLLFLFLALLLWLELPVLYWIGVVSESEHLYLVPYLRGKAFKLSPLSMILTEGLSCIAFIMLRYIPSITKPFTSILCTSQASRICWVLAVLSDRQDRSQSLGQPPEKLGCWLHSPTLSFPREKLGFGGFHPFAQG